MNRRKWLLGLSTLGSIALFADRSPCSVRFVPENPVANLDRLPSIVAGVRLPDTDIALKTIRLARQAYPPYLFNHGIRTFLLGSLVGQKRKMHFDEEALFLACTLHDLGLTNRFEGNLPFEIQGAQAARKFLEENGYNQESASIVWDGIAMHASPISQFKQPAIALVGEGAGADVVGPDFSEIRKEDVDEIVKAFPRLSFKHAFVQTCADLLRKYPTGASRSFMRDIGERYVSNFHPRNFCDVIAAAPYAE
jgi:hypothetical protein